MPLKIETVEDKQLPRWVYAMMSANQDPNADPTLADNPALKRQAKEKAENFYKKRQSRLKELAEQQGPQSASGRLTGMEWQSRPKNKFTSDELDKIMPTRRASYVIKKMAFISVVMAGVLAFTVFTVFIGASVCAEIKVGGNFHNAWITFSSSPSGYYNRVTHILNSDDNK